MIRPTCLLLSASLLAAAAGAQDSPAHIEQQPSAVEPAAAQVGVSQIPGGAVDAAVSVVRDNTTFPGSIGAMIEPIIPAVLSVRDKPGDFLETFEVELRERTL